MHTDIRERRNKRVKTNYTCALYYLVLIVVVITAALYKWGAMELVVLLVMHARFVIKYLIATTAGSLLYTSLYHEEVS